MEANRTPETEPHPHPEALAQPAGQDVLCIDALSSQARELLSKMLANYAASQRDEALRRERPTAADRTAGRRYPRGDRARRQRTWGGTQDPMC